MNFLTLNIPAGIRSHGVDLDSMGRWLEGNLVRWQDGSLRPVGGWLTATYDNGGVTTPITLPAASGAPRASHAWFDNTDTPMIGTATAGATAVSMLDGTVTDTTIAGLAVGNETAGENLSYGGKAYGRGDYGTQRTSDGVLQGATVWAIDNWGEFLIAVSEADKRLLIWKLAGAMTAISAEADAFCPVATSLVITQERFVMALGAGANPRKVQWCDREDYTVWEPLPTNEAGDFELATTGAIERAVRVRGRTLIVTTTDAHVAIYQGPPIVYGFQRVGSGCGIAAPMTLIAIGGFAMWMGEEGFYVYDGSSVQEIPCDVLDYVFDDINRTEIRQSWAVGNQRHSEIWFFYPSDGSTEIDSYVTFDYRENVWSTGKMNRTTGVDVGVFTQPIRFDKDGGLFFHEVGNLYDGAEPYVESGPIMLDSGHQVMRCTQMLTDERVLGQVDVSFKTLFAPDGTVYEYGPYTLPSPPVDVRFTGRQIRMRVRADEGTDWRLGPVRLRTESAGRR